MPGGPGYQPGAVPGRRGMGAAGCYHATGAPGRAIVAVRLIGAALGDPYDPHSVSGVPRHLFDALERRYPLAGRVDAALRPWQRYAVALVTFHPVRARWKERFWKNDLAFGLQSRNGCVGRARLGAPGDVVFQVHALFRTTGAPYVLYVDNTHHQSVEGWPLWNPLGDRDLASWYGEETAIYRDALHLFTMSAAAATSLTTFYGIPTGRVSTVGGGANFAALPPCGDAERAPTILFVGKDYPRKGGHVLTAAFAQVRRRLPDARLQIVGSAEAEPGPGIAILGRVNDRRALADLYARARVFCLPSLFEPYGLALVEAMAFGLPCVGTRVGGIPDVVVDGETGLLVPPDDPDRLAAALYDLLADPARAARYGAAGRRRVEEQLTWDRVVERMAPVLERLGVPPHMAAPARAIGVGHTHAPHADAPEAVGCAEGEMGL